MRAIWRVVVAVVCVAACVAAPLTAASCATRHMAVVIGNGLYTDLPALGSCDSSANVVSAALRRAGFDVSERTNLSNGQMGAAIGDFADRVAQAPDTVAVAYVCGYAVDFHGRVFLLPASAHLAADTDALTQGVSAATLANSLQRSGARASLVLLDAAGLPGRPPLSLAANLTAPGAPGQGLVAVQTLGPLPNGPSDLAAGLVETLSATPMQFGGFLQALRNRLPATPRLAVAITAPSTPAWLTGEPPVPAAPDAAIVDSAAPTPGGWQRIQAALQKLGYYDGRVDGVAGPETLAAVRRFQHEVNADMTGRLTPEQEGRLLAGK